MLELKDPESYEGYVKHPTEDNTIRKVIKATIKPEFSCFGYGLEIYFEGGERFYDWSATERGAKQKFAFQCRKGSVWNRVV